MVFDRRSAFIFPRLRGKYGEAGMGGRREGIPSGPPPSDPSGHLPRERGRMFVHSTRNV